MTTPASAFLGPVSNTVTAPEDLLNRVRGEYLEMPGLQLTLAQAARLWGLDRRLALALLEALVETGFLVRKGDGRYGRCGEAHGDWRNETARSRTLKTEW